MWILYFDGQASYWMHGDEEYVFGRRNTAVVISDDPSISRMHLTMAVGASSSGAPAPVKLTDSSKYGTQIVFHGSNANVNGELLDETQEKREASHPTQLSKDVAWTLPPSISEFRILLGNHGCEFTARWEPTPVTFCDISSEYLTKIEFGMARCGLYKTTDMQEAEVFLCGSTFEPIPPIAVALCRGKPLIDGLRYIDQVRNRMSPKFPPPCVFDTSVMPEVGAMWSDLVFRDSEALSDDVASLFTPRKERTTLLSGLHFVCPQKVLFKEVHGYLPFSQGKIYQDTPAVLAAGHNADEHYAAWAVRHQHHVVLYTTLTTFDKDLMSFCDRHGMVTLEYRDLIRGIVRAERPILGEFPEVILGKTDTSTPLGSNTSGAAAAMVMNSPVPLKRRSAASAETVSATPSRSPRLGGGGGGAVRKRGREVDGNMDDDDGELVEGDALVTHHHQHHQKQVASPDSGGARRGRGRTTSPAAAAEENDALFTYQEGLVMSGPPKLPPYPCFQNCEQPPGGNLPAEIGGGGGKKFQKQRIAVLKTGAEEMEAVAPLAVAITAKLPAVDAEAVVPSQVFIPTDDNAIRMANFNALDVQIEQRLQQKVTRTKKAAKNAANKSTSRISAAARALAPQVAAPPASTSPSRRQAEAPQNTTGGGGGGFNIFNDLDDLY